MGIRLSLRLCGACFLLGIYGPLPCAVSDVPHGLPILWKAGGKQVDLFFWSFRVLRECHRRKMQIEESCRRLDLPN